MTRGPKRTPVIERLMRRVVELDDGCWQWTGVVSRNGYGRIGLAGKYGRQVSTHRVAYEYFMATIPDDLTVDHLCRNRVCVNPYHMELVPGRLNVLRGMWATGRKAGQTHCVNGHEFNERNTYRASNGTRHCRVCGRLRAARYAADRRSKEGVAS